MRRMFTATCLVVALVAACSQAPAPVQPGPADAKAAPAGAANPESVPADVPIPIGLEGRKDSTVPGGGYALVQGQVSQTVPDAATAIRKQYEGAGWKATREPAPDSPSATIEFEKDAHVVKITLVKVQNTVTSVNLLVGPKAQ